LIYTPEGEALLKAEIAKGQVISVAATAEDTTLLDNSVHLIVAGQAFHWFDPPRAKVEFQRILKDKTESGLASRVILIWNDFHSDLDEGGIPVMFEYEQLLHKYGIEYGKFSHRRFTRKKTSSLSSSSTSQKQEKPEREEKQEEEKKDSIEKSTSEGVFDLFFSEYKYTFFTNGQILDEQGLIGRCLSSSYSPTPQHPNYLPLIEGLKKLFEKYQKNGHIEFIYRTLVFYGDV
jgi:ubiquinone/menaquinone biosynthesis C-methylase UbiE